MGPRLVLFESPNGTCFKYALTGFASREKWTLLMLCPSLKILHSTCSCSGRSYDCEPFMAPFFVTHPMSLFKNLFCPLFLCQSMFHALKNYPTGSKIDSFSFKQPRMKTGMYTHIYTHTPMWCPTPAVCPLCQMFRLRSMNQPSNRQDDWLWHQCQNIAVPPTSDLKALAEAVGPASTTNKHHCKKYPH